MIRVVIVDDHQLVRRGLISFIKAFDDLELVGEAQNGVEAIAICRETNPDVVLMDLVMSVMDGVTAIRRIREKQPNIQCIALTSASDIDTVAAALQAGAISYLLKDVSMDQLVSAIRAAQRHERTLSAEATQALIEAATRPASTEYLLSAREREVLQHIVSGMTNNAISDTMFISRSTVKFHVSSILAKLNVSTRSEAISVALKRGLVQ